MTYQYFGESATSKKIMLKIFSTNLWKELAYNGDERLAIIKSTAKLLGLNIEDFDIESAKAGLFSSNFMHELMEFEINRFDSNASYGGCMYETQGEQFSYVQDVANSEPDRVWTICLEGNSKNIAQGLHLVNRMGYLVAPINKPTGITFNEEWEEDDDELDN